MNQDTKDQLDNPEETQPDSHEIAELTNEQALEAQVIKLEEEVVHLKDQWLRAMAELDNLRKRSDREKDETRKYSTSGFAREMLSVSDNLRRALESCPVSADMPESVKGLISGVELTERELQTSFERQGIRAVNPLDEPFNPNFHQAMFEVEDAEKPAGTVVQVLQVGYVIYDRLLRPAMVAVTKAPQ